MTKLIFLPPPARYLKKLKEKPLDKIKDEKGLCKNYTGIGNFSNNDVLLKVDENVDLDYMIDLAMQFLIYRKRQKVHTCINTSTYEIIVAES